MKKVHVSLEKNSYDVLIEKGLLSRISNYVDSSKEYVIITDTNIPKEYISTVTSQLNVLLTYALSPGESLKCAEKVNEVIEDMLSHSIPRSITIIALGGGVIGDFSGYIASIYMRGVDFIQIPTSLLSQVDSSVGGKVGINSKHMKNAIGSFYQPKIVFIDPNTLQTLTKRHFNNGMAELIKHGLIAGKGLYEDLLQKDIHSDIEDFIYRSISIKRDIVIQDVKDKGVRQLLNFGHTIGHAIEQDSGYSLLHGESIAIGMLMMIKDKALYNDVRNLFRKCNLPISYTYDKEQLYNYIKTDKKITGDTLNIILLKEEGNAYIKTISLEQIKEYM